MKLYIDSNLLIPGFGSSKLELSEVQQGEDRFRQDWEGV